MNIKHTFFGLATCFVGLHSGMFQAMDANWMIQLTNQTNQTFFVMEPQVFSYRGHWLTGHGEGQIMPQAVRMCIVPRNRQPYSLSIRSNIGWYIWDEIPNMSGQSEFMLSPSNNNGVRLTHWPQHGAEAINLGVEYPHQLGTGNVNRRPRSRWTRSGSDLY